MNYFLDIIFLFFFRKQLLIVGFIFIFGAHVAFSQTINQPSSGNSSTTITCGTSYNYYDSGGSSSNYGASQTSTLTINPSTTGEYVQVIFKLFGIEECGGTSCTCDWLKIYDGTSTSDPLIDLYCNANSPTIITSSTGSLTFEFHSDSGTEEFGWEASVSCSSSSTPPIIIQDNLTETITCGTSYYYYDSGGSQNYSASEDLVLTLNPSIAGQYVQIDFTSGFFDVEADVSDCFDYMTIYDGSTTSSAIIGTFCNLNTPNTITSSTGSLTVKFSSDSGTELTGWLLNILCSSTPGANPINHPNTGNSTANIICGSNYSYYDSGGSLANYNNDEDGILTLIPSVTGQFIQIDFSTGIFNIETDVTECYDFISIYDGLSTSDPLIGTFCSLNTPSTVKSSTGPLTIAFSSDEATVKSGWDATISCSNTAGLNPIIQPNSGTQTQTITCGEIYDYYDSGAGGRNYGDHKNSLLTICPDAVGEYISIDLNEFEMEDNEDYLYVFDGNDASASILALYTGSVSSGTTVTASSNNTSGCLSFRSFSNEGTTKLGWSATITCEKTASVPISSPSNDCTGAVSVCSDENLNGGTLGAGYQELPSEWSSCLGIDDDPGEYQSNWYVFSSTTDGTVAFLLTPDAQADYDWAIWGPYASLECPAFTNDAPIRCSAASWNNSGPNGETGLQAGAGDTNEPSSGDGYLEPLNVLAGEVYIMMLDNWDSNDNPFELSWQLTNASLDCTPLPVTITKFNTHCENNKTYLEWNTISEINNNFFIIEKSTDAIHFKELTKISGNGNNNRAHHYSYIDSEQNSGIVYYRLLQVDFDGTVQYHPIIISDCSENINSNINARQIRNKDLLVEVEIPEGIYQLSIYDNSGKLIINQEIHIDTKFQDFNFSSTSFNNGLYLVLIQNNINRYSSKVIME